MSERKTMPCGVCPRGCFLEATPANDGTLQVVGNDCERGRAYAISQLKENKTTVPEVPTTTTEWKAFLKTEAFLDLVRPLYIDDSRLAQQPGRYLAAIEEFEKLYGAGDARIFSAPGRSEVGGNHTDHQHGKVLACSLNLDAITIVRETGDNVIYEKSQGHEANTVDLSVLEPVPEEKDTSTGMIRGVAASLKEAGFSIGGFQAYTTSDVLSGSGMSSSAAFEVLMGTVLSGLYNDGAIPATEIAKASQKAENKYFGKPSGLLDQMACAMGNLVFMDFKHPASPVITQVKADFSQYGHKLCIVDTKGSHSDLTPDYAAVPEEMKQVAAFFKKEVLRDVEKDEFLTRLPKLRKTIGDRALLRALHFFEENMRVDKEVVALETGTFERFLQEVRASGDSSYRFLQNVYSPAHPDRQAIPLALALSEEVLKDRGACRVHGGGFAGTIQAFVPEDLADEYRTKLDTVFGEGSCQFLQVRPIGGCEIK